MRTPLFFKYLVSVIIAIALLAPGAYLAMRPTTGEEDAQALVGVVSAPILETIQGLWSGKEAAKDVGAGIEKAVASGLRVVLRTAYKGFLVYATESLFDQVAFGVTGQQPMFEQRNWQEYWGDVMLNAGSQFVEVFVTQAYDSINGVAIGGDVERLTQLSEQCASGLGILPVVERTSVIDAVTRFERIGGQKYADIIKNSPGYSVILNTQLPAEIFANVSAAYRADCDAINAKLANRQKDLAQADALAQQRKKENFNFNTADASPEAKQFFSSLVCNPSAGVAVQIGLGLGQTPIDKQPTCRINDAWNNWSRVISSTGIGDPNRNAGWGTLFDMVRVDRTDLGIAFNAHLAQQATVQWELNAETAKREGEDQNLKSIVDPVSKQTRTPGKLISELLIDTTNQNNDVQWSNDVWADFLTVTIDTISGTLFNKVQKYLTQGVVKKGQPNLYSAGNYVFAGKRATKVYTSELAKISYTRTDSEDILSILAVDGPECASPDTITKDPDTCTIGREFEKAIRSGMTVAEAIAANEKNRDIGLDPNKPFGFSSSGKKQPGFKEGYPYRSLVILRKYRIIPVTWELAATIIRDNYESLCVGDEKKCSLGEVIKGYNNIESPFYGLVDPSWVLTSPKTRCELKGPGPALIESKSNTCQFDTNGDGTICCARTCTGQQGDSCIEQCPNPDEEQPTTQRMDACVDTQTCLKEDENGKCMDKDWGYCIEEKQEWKLPGEACDQRFDSCLTLTRSSTNAAVAVLTNTITSNFGKGSVCTANNVGCKWLSKVFQPASRETKPWSDVSDARVYFTEEAEKQFRCDIGAEGCRNLTVPGQTGSASTAYIRVAPDYLRCDPDRTYADGKKGDPDGVGCDRFTRFCAAADVGCRSYTPQDGEGALGLKFPNNEARNALSCNSACTSLASFIQSPTQFEQGVPSVLARPDMTQACSASEVGCEQYTNLNAPAGSGESTATFRILSACERKTPESKAFYTWYGSDRNGFRVSTVYLKTDTAGAPSVTPFPDYDITAITATTRPSCDKALFDKLKTTPDPRYGFYCKEFFDTTGKVYYLDTDRIVYHTDDCTTYRNRAGEEVQASPSRSIACSAAAIGCREYKGTQTGNAQLVSSDTFESKTKSGWMRRNDAGGAGIKPSSEAVLQGGTSLLVEGGTGEQFVEKAISISPGYGYRVSLLVKGKSGASVRAQFVGNDGAQATSISVSLGSEDWQRVDLTIPVITLNAGQTLQYVRIFHSAGAFNIDDVVVRQSQGYLYALKASVETSAGSCDASQLGCRLFTDPEGATVALKPPSINAFCPLQSVGCRQYANPNSAENEMPGALYLVPSDDKTCTAEENKCTAYGVPTIGTDGNVAKEAVTKSIGSTKTQSTREVWRTVFYKILPKQAATANNGVCTADAVGCTRYTGTLEKRDIGPIYEKDFGTKFCTYKTAQETGKKASGWYRDVCAGTDTLCTSNEDCKKAGYLDGKAATCEKDSSCTVGESTEAVPNSVPEFVCAGTLRACSRTEYTNNATENQKVCSSSNPCIATQTTLLCANPTNGVIYANGTKTDNIDGVTGSVCDKSGDACTTAYGSGQCKTWAEIRSIRTTPSRAPAQSAIPGWALGCPAAETGCRIITDPLCSGDGCTKAYPIKTLDTTRDKCDAYNPREGCILVQDPRAEGGEPKYSAKGFDDVYNTKSAKEQEKGISLTEAGTGEKTANLLLKAVRTRNCKTWLSCVSSVTQLISGGPDRAAREVCFERIPCRENDEAGNCIAPVTDPKEKKLFEMAVIGSPYKKPGASADVFELFRKAGGLSGLSRPALTFLDQSIGIEPGGGYAIADYRTQGELTESLYSGRPIVRAGKEAPSTDDVSFQDRRIMNSCRLYPQENAPAGTKIGDVQSWRKLEIEGALGGKPSGYEVDACYYQDGSLNQQTGVYGYCLEPYPNSNAKLQYASRKNPNPASQDATVGYSNFCLNWYPVDYIKGQYDALATQKPLAPYTGIKPLYYCLQSTGGAYGFLNAPGSVQAIKAPVVKTRDTSAYRMIMMGLPGMVNKTAIGRELGALESNTRQYLNLSQEVQADLADTSTLLGTIGTIGPGITVVSKGGTNVDRDKISGGIYFSNTQFGVKVSLPYQQAAGQRKPSFKCNISAEGVFSNETILDEGDARQRTLEWSSSEVAISGEVYTVAEKTFYVDAMRLGDGRVSVTCTADFSDAISSGLGSARTKETSASTAVSLSVRGDKTFAVDYIQGNTYFKVGDTIKLLRGFAMGSTRIQLMRGVKLPSQLYCAISPLKLPSVADDPSQYKESFNLGTLPSDNRFWPTLSLENSTIQPRDGFAEMVLGTESTGSTLGDYGFVVRCIDTTRISRSAPTFEQEQLRGNLLRESPDLMIPLKIGVVNSLVGYRIQNFVRASIDRILSIPRKIARAVSTSVDRVFDIEPEATFRTAVSDGKTIIKPMVVAKDSKGAVMKEVKFADKEFLEGTSKKINIFSEPKASDLSWRALIAPEGTDDVGRGEVFHRDWIELGRTVNGVTTWGSMTNGFEGGTLEMRINRNKIITPKADGVYRGRVRVYMIGPSEGMEKDESYIDISVTATITAATQEVVSGIEGDSPLSPGNIPTREIFDPTIFFNKDGHREADIFKDGERVIKDFGPEYKPGENADITLTFRKYGAIETFNRCQPGTPIKAMIAYRFLGTDEWSSIPKVTTQRTGVVLDRNSNGTETTDIRDYNFNAAGTCGDGIAQFFPIRIDRAPGMEYYFVVEYTNSTGGSTKFIRTELQHLNIAEEDEVDGAVSLSSQARNVPGLIDKPYASKPDTGNDINLTPYVKSGESPLDYSTYRRSTLVSNECGKEGCCTTFQHKEIDREWEIKSIASSNDPYSYRGEKIEWVAKDNRTRLNTKDEKSEKDETGGIWSNKTYLMAQLNDVEVIKKKFIASDNAYPGKVEVTMNEKTVEYTTRSGSCGSSKTITASNSRTEVFPRSVGLFVKPKMKVTKGADATDATELIFLAGEVSTGGVQTMKPVSDIPPLTYHWRAEVEYIDRPSPVTGGDVKWLDIIPRAGMSGTPISVRVQPDVFRDRNLVEAKARIKIYATSPVAGDVSIQVPVTVKLNTGSRPQVQTHGPVMYKAAAGAETDTLSPEEWLGVQYGWAGSGGGCNALSVDSKSCKSSFGDFNAAPISYGPSSLILSLVADIRSRESSDSGVQVTPANILESRIHRDQIAQIEYVVDWASREGLPGAAQGRLPALFGGVNFFTGAPTLKTGRPEVDAIIKLTGDIALRFRHTELWYWVNGLDANTPQAKDRAKPSDRDRVNGSTNFISTNLLQGDGYTRFRQFLEEYPSPVIKTDAKTGSGFTMAVDNSFASNVTPSNIFSTKCSEEGRTGDTGKDFAGVRPIFNTSGFISGWSWRLCDGSGADQGVFHAMGISVRIHLLDYCTDVVQVATARGDIVPWYEKTQKLGNNKAPEHSVPASTIYTCNGGAYDGQLCRLADRFIDQVAADTNTQMDKLYPNMYVRSGCGVGGKCELTKIDFVPMKPPAGQPQQWTSYVPALRGDERSGIASAAALGSPGQSRYALCVGGSRDGEACSSSADCGGFGAYCFGPSGDLNKTRAVEELKKMYAKSFGYWTWDRKERRYIPGAESSIGRWDVPSTICSPAQVAQRANSLCAVRPKISNFRILDGSNGTANETRYNKDSTTVTIEFASTVDAQQKPLKEIEVDWGDGNRSLIKTSADSQTHKFTHTYFKEDSLSICPNEYCAKEGGGKVYRVFAHIKDNWGWCSDDKAGEIKCAADAQGVSNITTYWNNSPLLVHVGTAEAVAKARAGTPASSPAVAR